MSANILRPQFPDRREHDGLRMPSLARMIEGLEEDRDNLRKLCSHIRKSYTIDDVAPREQREPKP